MPISQARSNVISQARSNVTQITVLKILQQNKKKTTNPRPDEHTADGDRLAENSLAVLVQVF